MSWHTKACECQILLCPRARSRRAIHTIEKFRLRNILSIKQKLKSFIDSVDKIYLTIDLDGFSSAYAPGVSAPSPLGFSPEMAMEVIRIIKKSGKLISMDIAELNPRFDLDHRTARLAAILMHQVSSLN